MGRGPWLSGEARMDRFAQMAPLVHHHHRGYEWGIRLCHAADGGDEERRQTAEGFLAYFYGESLAHMREEESALFPLLGSDESGDLQLTLREHDAISAGARRLADALDGGVPEGESLRALGMLVREHIRREERRLYPAAARSIERRQRLRDALETEHPEFHLG